MPLAVIQKRNASTLVQGKHKWMPGTWLLACLFSMIVFPSAAQNNGGQSKADQIIRHLDSAMQLLVGTPYPDFEHRADNGILYSKKMMLGKRYYINFWFEACPPCMAEMDSLIALNNQLQNTAAEFLSFTWDKPETIQKLRREKKLNFIIIPVSMDECYRLNLHNGFPFHIVIDEKGNIAYIPSIMNPSEKTLHEVADLLLTKK